MAQFGGRGNLAHMQGRALEVAKTEPFRSYLESVEIGTHYEDAESTRARMEAAGFVVSEARLHTEAPCFESRERFAAFLRNVNLRQLVAKLPEGLRGEFIESVVRRLWDEEGTRTLDYVRLTVRAAKS